MNNFLLQFEEENVQKRGELCSRLVIQILERECVSSLYISHRLDRRFSTEQKAKSIYAARAMRGH